ncbi:hypothetical protein UFOVP1017_48 [uncultured Caudovirales phage]|uniref:Uncharacterized protein n=1 Tax=uncultured Caudovirales phage TaxID=2100421 RepID=A0A6J5QAH6_9CAUD|nr:hypothetical protein UFOVP511_48 [uncultured Caudovirales phage]CAB4178541.1 hypothetical protein UFOVP1017_48 [uncultured Caudovirales phage]CAB4188037.1 hypothetical protein UFOVP1168_48 [uncultured Caudovirales phage]CAB4219551.1 hypothetical protein UFOVP1617_4 [uncultured Caudovirales phage]
MAFEYTPYRNPYIGTIADLMARGEDAKAKALIDVASAQARAAEAKGQIYGNAISSIGNQIGNIPAQMQANKEQAFKADQQARMVRGQQREDAAEDTFNQIMGQKNVLGGMFGPMSAPVVTPATTTAGTDMESENIPDTPETQTLPSRAFMPTVTNPFKELSVRGVDGLDKWDVEKASQQFASLGLGVEGQKYLELMRGSNDDMDKHHASAMSLVQKSAARALQAGSFDMMLGSTNALMSQLANNKVIGREDLNAFQQQLDGLNALPQQKREGALRGILRNISGQERNIGNVAPGASIIDLDTQEVLGQSPRPDAPVTLVGAPVARNNPQTGKPELVQRYSDGTTKYFGDPVPSNKAAGSEVSPTALLNATMGLRTQVTRELNASKAADIQLANMEDSLAAVKSGNAAAGSQGVLVTFQKILDELSVVRESEYARSASGLSLLNRLRGSYDKIVSGGAGVPVEQLEDFVVLARQFTKNQKDATAQTVESVSSIVEQYGINPVSVFGKREATTPPPSTKAPTGRYDSATGKIVPIGGA